MTDTWLLRTGTWLIHDWYMNDTCLTHDWHMIDTWLYITTHEWHLTNTWLPRDWRMIDTWLTHDWHMIDTWLAYDWNMTVHEWCMITNDCTWTIHNWRMTGSWQDKTTYDRRMNAHCWHDWPMAVMLLLELLVHNCMHNSFDWTWL